MLLLLSTKVRVNKKFWCHKKISYKINLKRKLILTLTVIYCLAAKNHQENHLILQLQLKQFSHIKPHHSSLKSSHMEHTGAFIIGSLITGNGSIYADYKAE